MAYRRPLICAPMGMGPLAVGSHSTSVLSASPAGAALWVLRWLLYWPSTVEPVASSAYRVASVLVVAVAVLAVVPVRWSVLSKRWALLLYW